MWSRPASALVPSTVTTLPLTCTRPCSIMASALRRLATPAAARVFWRRSSLGGGRGAGVNSGSAAASGSVSVSDLVPASFAVSASPSVSSPMGSLILGTSAWGAAANSGSADSGLRGAVFLLFAIFFVTGFLVTDFFVTGFFVTVFFALGLAMGKLLGFCLLCRGERSRSGLFGGGGLVAGRRLGGRGG